LPVCNENGDLPTGLHPAALREVLNRFGAGSTMRHFLGQRLERIYRLAAGSGHLGRFVVFGSFITDKNEPNDVDVFLLMEDASAQVYLGASIFWLRRLAVLNSEEMAIADWQIKRDGSRRGIVEIVSE
jgi:hypothetical protein